LNGVDTTHAQRSPLPDQVPRQACSHDCGFWVMSDARQFLRNDRLAPGMETGQLRLSLLEDLWQGIQGRNTARNDERRPTTEAYSTGLRNNILRSVYAIRREADNGDTRMQTLNPHQYFRSEAHHAAIYSEWGYTLEPSWFRGVFQSASTSDFNSTILKEWNCCSLPLDKTLQPWHKLSDFAHLRVIQATRNKDRLREIEEEEGLGTDRYSGSDWESMLKSAEGRVEDAWNLNSAQDGPDKIITPPRSQLSIRGAESIMDTGSSVGPASLPSPSVSLPSPSMRQLSDSGSDYGIGNIKGPRGRGKGRGKGNGRGNGRGRGRRRERGRGRRRERGRGEGA
jgi:hypothetical protein